MAGKNCVAIASDKRLGVQLVRAAAGCIFYCSGPRHWGARALGSASGIGVLWYSDESSVPSPLESS